MFVKLLLERPDLVWILETFYLVQLIQIFGAWRSRLSRKASFPTDADNGLTTVVREIICTLFGSVDNVYGPGSWLYAVAMHELGHSMGLAHPHDGYVFPGVTGMLRLY